MKKKIINKRYEELITIINKHNLLYHTYDSPEILDSEYDELYTELKKIEKNNPSIIEEYSPTQRVGSSILENFEKRAHEIPMLSLSNASSEEEFNEFYTKILTNLGKEKFELFAEPKFDGLAVNISYQHGKFINATTRGDGLIGEDVTTNVKTIKALPIKIITSSLPDKFDLRGEIFIDKNDFRIINQKLKNNNEKEYSNPRNLAAGSIRQLNPSIASSRNLKLFIHGISDYKSFVKFKNHSDLMLHLSDVGFPINKYSKKMNCLSDCYDYFMQMRNIRNTIPYEIDGLVYRVNDFSVYDSLGFTSKSPKWAIAYKFKSLEAITKIRSVTFQVGRTGTITPVAELDTVNIGGVSVSRATLHNFSEIENKDININDYVYVKRAGDVIPDIDRVALNKRKNIKRIIPPKKCPSCSSELTKVNDQVALKCINSKKCIPQIEGSIIHFISRRGMNIIGIGDKIIKELIEKKIIKRFADIYNLKADDFNKLERVGAKSIENYISAIEKSKKVSFSKFIYSLGIKEVGESSSKSLATEFNTLNDLINCSLDKLIQIDDVGPIVAENIVSYMNDNDNKKNIFDLVKSGIKIVYSKNIKHDKTAVITGSFENYSREELKNNLELIGYKITNSVTKKTSILICGEKPGSKLTKAKDLKVKILNEKHLSKLLSESH